MCPSSVFSTTDSFCSSTSASTPRLDYEKWSQPNKYGFLLAVSRNLRLSLIHTAGSRLLTLQCFLCFLYCRGYFCRLGCAVSSALPCINNACAACTAELSSKLVGTRWQDKFSVRPTESTNNIYENRDPKIEIPRPKSKTQLTAGH